jgi:hypothetical protein
VSSEREQRHVTTDDDAFTGHVSSEREQRHVTTDDDAFTGLLQSPLSLSPQSQPSQSQTSVLALSSTSLSLSLSSTMLALASSVSGRRRHLARAHNVANRVVLSVDDNESDGDGNAFDGGDDLSHKLHTFDDVDVARLIDVRDRERFRCEMCHQVVKNARGFNPPEDMDPCKHIFCCGCIELWCTKTKNARTCCVCKHGSPPVDMANVIEGLLSSSLVKCDVEGCTQQYELETKFVGIKKHLAKCGYVTVECPNRSCKEKMLRKDVVAHQQECEAREVKCDICREMLLVSAMEDHKNTGTDACKGFTLCPNKCTQGDNNFVVPPSKRQVGPDGRPLETNAKSLPMWFNKSSMATHEKVCPLRVVACILCDETYPLKDKQVHAQSAVVKHMETMNQRMVQFQRVQQSRDRNCFGVDFPHSKTETFIDDHYKLEQLGWSNEVLFPADGDRPMIRVSFTRSVGDGGNSLCRSWLKANFAVLLSPDNPSEVTEHTYAIRVFVVERGADGNHDVNRQRHCNVHVLSSVRSNLKRSWNSIPGEHLMRNPLITVEKRYEDDDGDQIDEDFFCLGVQLMW